MKITDGQIRELWAYAQHIGDARLVVTCALALTPRARSTEVERARGHCESAYERATQTLEWAARHLPYGAFRVAEMIAQFLLDEARECDHLEAVHNKLVEMATRIRTADWIKGDPC